MLDNPKSEIMEFMQLSIDKFEKKYPQNINLSNKGGEGKEEVMNNLILIN